MCKTSHKVVNHKAVQKKKRWLSLDRCIYAKNSLLKQRDRRLAAPYAKKSWGGKGDRHITHECPNTLHWEGMREENVISPLPASCAPAPRSARRGWMGRGQQQLAVSSTEFCSALTRICARAVGWWEYNDITQLQKSDTFSNELARLTSNKIDH
jgi:hypothetical protein